MAKLSRDGDFWQEQATSVAKGGPVRVMAWHLQYAWVSVGLKGHTHMTGPGAPGGSPLLGWPLELLSNRMNDLA